MNDIRPVLRQVLGWIAFGLAVIALGKMFGFRVPVPGSVEANAMVAAALALARI